MNAIAGCAWGARLALGTAQFGLPYGISNRDGQPSSESCADILQGARRAGITMLDTAIAYGSSERVLGDLGIQDLQVITKLPAMPQGCLSAAEWVEIQLGKTLSRLRRSHVDGLLLHRPAQLNSPEGVALYKALLQQKEKGLACKIGISIYGPQELEALPDGMRMDIVQAPLNIIDQRMITTGWAHRIKDSGVELHVRSIFLQGLLLMSATERPSQFSRWQPMWKSWDEWLDSTGLTGLQACLRYALALPWPDKIVVGVNSASQLEEILQAIPGRLPALPQSFECDDVDLLNPSLWQPS